MRKDIDVFLQRRMDRKDFLKHVGMGVAVITGTAGVVKLLKPAGQSTRRTQSVSGLAYGASPYGGSLAAKRS